jgi:NAD(P)-dependent dehydrogenase (short-subunit alcohol dehydrogenase family)
VVKFTENLARETLRHGISVFSVHPGLLPIGLTELVRTDSPAGGHRSGPQVWVRNQLDQGGGCTRTAPWSSSSAWRRDATTS